MIPAHGAGDPLGGPEQGGQFAPGQGPVQIVALGAAPGQALPQVGVPAARLGVQAEALRARPDILYRGGPGDRPGTFRPGPRRR